MQPTLRQASPAVHRPRHSQPRRLASAELAGLVQPGDQIFVPGSSGAPQDFMRELARDPESTPGVRLLTSYVPGINQLALDGLHPTAQVSGLFMQSSLTSAQRQGRFRALPMSYAGFVRHLSEQVDLDLTVVQVSAPDAQGFCSLGPAVEFVPVALKKTRRLLGLINRQTPAIPGAVKIAWQRFDYVCEVDTPLPTYAAPPDATTEAIARHIASLVEDGCTLQVGLGKVPAALMRQLEDRRGLRLHSGMLSDGFFDLAQAGALDMDYLHSTCVLVGSQAFYQQMRTFSPLRVVGCDITHDPAVLSAIPRLIAVNSALEVDLFGQCNLEHNHGQAISGCGGAPDFARAGRLSPGGYSIVALPASHKHGSRLLAQLSAQSVTTLTRSDVDYVVTEHGCARLHGASVHERAQALIQIADPEYRAELQSAWTQMAARL